MTYKDILGITPSLTSLALASEGYRVVKKKKKKLKDITSLGVKNLVGTALIKEQAGLI